MSTSPITRLSETLRGRGLVRPPTLQTGEPRGASQLELFFDLAFVLVIAELASGLRQDVTVPALLRFVGLFSVVWWAWMSSTLYANRFDHDDVLYRVYKLGGMVAVLGMAAAASGATGQRATAFAVSYLVFRLLLLAQYARAYRHVVEARAGIRIYLLGTGAGAAVWAVSLAVPEPARYWLWGAGVLVDAVAPALVTVSRAEVPLHLEHLPERFSLFVILVLGESIVAVAQGVRDASWSAGSVVTGATCFVLVAALWWTFFDLAGAGAKHLLGEAGDSTSTRAHDVYVYAQLPLCLALAAIGVGVQVAVLDSVTPASAGAQLLLPCGVAVYLLTVALTNVVMSEHGRSGWWWMGAASAVAVADALVDLPALVVAAVLAALLVGIVVVGLDQQGKGHLEFEKL